MAKLGRYSADRKKIEQVTANKTVDVSDCGTIFIVNPAADTLLTLPTSAAAGKGWWIKVIITELNGGAVDNDVNITASGGEFFHGLITGDAQSLANGSSHDFIRFDASNAKSGDMVEIISDGVNYYVHGLANTVANNGVSFGTAALS